MHRRLTAALASAVLLVLLSGCALPLPIPKGPIAVPAPVEKLDDAELAVGSCLHSTSASTVDADDVVACTGSHTIDVVALLDWPGMDELLDEWPAKTVWDEVSDYYPLKGLATEYTRWARGACTDAFRKLIGWDAIEVQGRSAHDIELLPGGPYELVATVGDASTFSGGDHRTRCIARWYDPISYDADVTIADIVTPRFPSAARDCFARAADYSLEYVDCELAHTEQTMVTVDAYDAFGDDVVQFLDVADTATQDRADLFCGDAIAAAFGAWNEYNHWSWGGSIETAHWTALRDAPPHADASYPFACLLASYDGEFDMGDLIKEASS